MMSMGAIAPSSERLLLSLYSLVLSSRVFCLTFKDSLKDTRSQYRLTTLFTVAITWFLNCRSETWIWFFATVIARRLTEGRKPCSRFCWIENERLAWVY